MNIKTSWFFDIKKIKHKFDSFIYQKNQNHPRRKLIRRSLYLLIVLVAVFSYLTNPFVKFSIVTDPYKTVAFVEDEFVLEKNESLIVKEDPFFSKLAVVKAAYHIVASKFAGGKKARAASVDDIIVQIHHDRFDPEEPYLISGDHFSVLYPRSLGIFYHSLLDSRTALNELDWHNRQLIYLKTLAYALQVYSQTNRLSTTIVPVGPRSVALMNIYNPPSDTLFSLLFAMKVLTDESELRRLYNFDLPKEKETYSLQTKDAANLLLSEYKSDLKRHVEIFMNNLYDTKSGLVRTDKDFSGTKDIVYRESAFYHNIMVWRTNQLAQELGIIEPNPDFLDRYKQRIVDAYWNEDEGIFIEDLSQASLEEVRYSSDWMVAYQTGFLDPANEEDRYYLERSVEYIKRNAIDQPFGLQYNADRRPEILVPTVRIFAPDYASTAIWSHWGMEYIKLLTDLYIETDSPEYLVQAEKQIDAYTFNIKRYRGYPEVYDSNGDFFRQTIYKSIRQTGWIVNFEQARAMFEWASGE